MNLTGIVFTDTSGDGVRGLGEPTIANALIEVFNDVNANGLIDDGQPALASATSGERGLYILYDLMPSPGYRLVRMSNLPGGSSPNPIPTIISSQPVGLMQMNLPPTPGTVAGVAWSDLDGDEEVDAGEPFLANARVLVFNGAQQIAERRTDAAGAYSFGESAAPGLPSPG